MIATGTRIEFDVRGSVGEFLPRTVDDVRQLAINSMSPYVTVESVSLSRTDNAFWREYWDWGYTSVTRVRTVHDHASISDLVLIVRNAFTTASGEIPTVTANGYSESGVQDSEGQPGGTSEPQSSWLGLGIFGLAAIAVAVFVAKRG